MAYLVNGKTVLKPWARTKKCWFGAIDYRQDGSDKMIHHVQKGSEGGPEQGEPWTEEREWLKWRRNPKSQKMNWASVSNWAPHNSPTCEIRSLLDHFSNWAIACLWAGQVQTWDLHSVAVFGVQLALERISVHWLYNTSSLLVHQPPPDPHFLNIPVVGYQDTYLSWLPLPI